MPKILISPFVAICKRAHNWYSLTTHDKAAWSRLSIMLLWNSSLFYTSGKLQKNKSSSSKVTGNTFANNVHYANADSLSLGTIVRVMGSQLFRFVWIKVQLMNISPWDISKNSWPGLEREREKYKKPATKSTLKIFAIQPNCKTLQWMLHRVYF